MAEPTQQFGKYQTLVELGRGGFATVYRAKDVTLERDVALKILHPQLLSDIMFVQRFRQEARTLAGLRNPHIITIYEVGEAEGRLFIAMELAVGTNLAQHIVERGQVPWEEMMALLKPICDALNYAHEQEIIHRDLKPANILLDRERGPLLTDFGFARLMAQNSVSLSMSGGIVGTPGYIAPEVWDLNSTARSVDIYALGCIVYEMLTGAILFAGDTPMQAMRAHDHGPQFPELWPTGIPTGIDRVLNKALARDPATRYASAAALWHALEDLSVGARMAQETAAAATLATQWKNEAEAALAAGELSRGRMAISRWLALAPDDPDALALRARLEQSAARPLSEPQQSARLSGNTTELEEARSPGRRRVPVVAWVLSSLAVLGVMAGSVFAIMGATGTTLTPSPVGQVTVIAAVATSTAAVVPTSRATEAATVQPSATTHPSPSTAPTITAEPARPTTTAQSGRVSESSRADAVAQADLNMRAGPGSGYEALSSYSGGANFRVLGRDAQSEWIQVRSPDDRIGWIKATLLQLTVSLPDVPVVPAPPTRILATPVAATSVPPTPIKSPTPIQLPTQTPLPPPPSITYQVDIVSISLEEIVMLPGCQQLAHSPDLGASNNVCIVGPGGLDMQVENLEERAVYPFPSDARQLYFRPNNRARVSVVSDRSGSAVTTTGNNLIVPQPGKYYKIVVQKS